MKPARGATEIPAMTAMRAKRRSRKMGLRKKEKGGWRGAALLVDFDFSAPRLWMGLSEYDF
jgi:hypothetical protein